MNKIQFLNLYLFSLISLFSFTAIGQVNEQQIPDLGVNADFTLSPFTGYTRDHWISITEKMIAGVLPYFDTKSGLPDLPYDPNESGYSELRYKMPSETYKRALERIMTLVIYYSKGTGKDKVPGYKGSITKPFIKGIVQGTDPESPYYWGDIENYDHVGSSFALAVYINPEKFWDPLSKNEKKNLLIYLQKLAFSQSYDNNHHYFHMTGVPLLEKNGMDANREHLSKMLNKLMGDYRHDGWFIDGMNRSFDYYNNWAFQLYNNILLKYDPIWGSQYGDFFKETTEKFLESYKYIVGRDGAPVPWGRSLTYRFASNAAISWASINGINPLPPGQARRIVSGTLKYFWEHRALNENGLLSIGYRDSNTSIAETYIAVGDTYWAGHGLACLLIPETDPFWTDTELAIPADEEGGKLTIPGAQMSVRVSSIDGESRVYPVGQPFAHRKDKWQIYAKYDQHAYSSFLGFCVIGEKGGDIGAGRSGYSFDGKNWYFREGAEPLQIEKDHLVSIYRLRPENGIFDDMTHFTSDKMITHTLVGDDGEVHVFWHNYPKPLYMYMGGYGIQIPEGRNVKVSDGNNKINIQAGENYSLIQPVSAAEGTLNYEKLLPRKGWNHTHLFGGLGIFPSWKSNLPIQPHDPVIIYVNGTRDRKPGYKEIKVETNDGILNIYFEEKWYTIDTPFY